MTDDTWIIQMNSRECKRKYNIPQHTRNDINITIETIMISWCGMLDIPCTKENCKLKPPEVK